MRGTMHWRVDAVVLAFVNAVKYSVDILLLE